MRVEEAVEALNQYIDDIRSYRGIEGTQHLVVQKSIQPTIKFKAYKEFNVTIWVVGNNLKHKFITFTCTARIVAGQDDVIVNKLEIGVMKQLYGIIRTNLFDQLIENNYESITRDE